MRITKVSVEKLFGIFDHEIPLNQDSRITIIHGPNGVGKTVLLNMLHGLFHYEYERIGKMIPFRQFRIEFEDGAFITGEKSADNRELSIQYDDGTGTEFEPFEPRFVSDVYEEIHDHAPSDKSNIHLLEDFYENHSYLEDVPDKRSLDQNPDMHTKRYGKTPEWFWHIRKGTRIVLIHTQRLQSDLFDEYGLPRPDVVYGAGDVPASTVIDLSRRFEKYVGDYVSNDELGCFVADFASWEKLNELAEKRAAIETELAEAGVLKDEELIESRLKELREQLQLQFQQIVNMHQDTEFVRELLLFRDIINGRLLFKSLDITSIDEGFWFVADDGSKVPLYALSSGEQNLIVLYYQLLFEIQPDTLVMIDEPELSMNVVWQRNFLKDLQRIIELRKFDVLVATHSPQIIHDKWDWMVALGEPEGES